MLAVRYAALVTLVVWLGGMIATELLGAGPFQPFRLVAYVCGVTMFICLFVIKFVGPPPHGFIPRAAIVTVMLGLQLYSDFVLPTSTTPTTPTTIMMILGFVLLFWYVRE